MKMISIVIPLYNKEKYISQTIKYVLDQTYDNFELIIVNDGSLDNGAAVASAFSDKRIRLINQENRGVSAARNRGVKEAKSEYIAFLDADDKWTPSHLYNIASLMDKYPNRGVYATNFSLVKNDSNVFLNRDDISTGVINDYFKIALKKPLLHPSNVCISKGLFIEVGGFKENLSRGEDLELWARLSKRSDIIYNSICSSYYFLGTENNSREGASNIEKSFVNYIDFSIVENSSERKYLRRLITRKILSLLVKEKNISDAFKLLVKYKKNLL